MQIVEVVYSVSGVVHVLHELQNMSVMIMQGN